MSTPVLVMVVIAAAVGAAELILWALVWLFRPNFQWLIRPADETPDFPDDLIEKYVRLSFDKDLGWARRPGTTGIEQTEMGETTFLIDETGCRENPGWTGQSSDVAVFGDSFAFCRLVNDDETWPHALSKLLNTNVRNFGVGNYGIDQAFLRVRREIPDLSADDIVMNVVPETISRIHSYWRHYFEYGNILAFKPRFRIENGELREFPSAIRSPEDFQSYDARLDEIRNLDDFYESKFKPDLLRFPLIARALVRGRRLLPILGWLIYGLLPGRAETARAHAFRAVMAENARVSARLYQRDDAKQLLAKLVKEFADLCRAQGKRPWLVITPQPVDLGRVSKGDNDFGDFFGSLSDILPVLDITEVFARDNHLGALFVEGKLGPHPSPLGNQTIATEFAAMLANVRDQSLAQKGTHS